MAADEAQIVYADTSGLYALLDAADGRHDEASTIVRSLLSDGAVLVTSNYVVTELTALVQSRLGLDVALRVHRALLPALEVVFVDRGLHEWRNYRHHPTHPPGLSPVPTGRYPCAQ